jgi:PQQ-like domain
MIPAFFPAFFWTCGCCKPTGYVTWRRYGTANPPDFEQLCDTGAACTPFAVDSSAAVYLGGGVLGATPSKYAADGTLAWSANFAGTVGGAAVSPDGTKVLFTGTFELPSVTATLTATAAAFQTGTGGAVTLGDASDTLQLSTDYAAFQFVSPIPQYGSGSGILSLYCPNSHALAANLYANAESGASPLPLAATPFDISSRVLQPTAAVWDAAAVVGWNAPGIGINIGGSQTGAGYAPGNLMTVVLQGRPTEFQPCDLEVDLAANPPTLAFTYQWPAMCAICCDAATGAILWAQSPQSIYAATGFNAFFYDGGAAGMAIAAPDSAAFFFTASNGDTLIGVDAATGEVRFASWPLNPNPIGGLAFSGGQLYAAAYGVFQIDQTAGGIAASWYSLGNLAAATGQNNLVAYSDGTFGGISVGGGFGRFQLVTVEVHGGSIPEVSGIWGVSPLFLPPDTLYGFTACAVDSENNTYLVNGGELWRVNNAGETVYTYPVPLPSPQVWTLLTAAHYLQVDSAGEPIIGGQRVLFQSPG